MTTSWMLPEGGTIVSPLFFAQATPPPIAHADHILIYMFLVLIFILGFSALFGFYMDLKILQRRLEYHQASVSAQLEGFENFFLPQRAENITSDGRPTNQKSRRKNIVEAMEAPPKQKPSMTLQRKSRENLVADTDVHADPDRIFD